MGLDFTVRVPTDAASPKFPLYIFLWKTGLLANSIAHRHVHNG